MPRVDRPLFGDSASGPIADTLFFYSGSVWPCVRGKFSRGPSPSLAQLAAQSRFASLAQTWHTLDSYTVAQYNAAASGWMSGYSLFLSLNL